MKARRAIQIALIVLVAGALQIPSSDFGLEIASAEAKRRNKSSKRGKRKALRIQRHLHTAEYYLIREKNLKAAAKELRRVLEIDRAHVPATLALADVHVKQKKTKKAIRLLEKLAKKEPKESLVWHALGRAFAAAGNDKKAVKAYRSAIKLNSRDSVARWLVFESLYKRYRDGDRRIKRQLRRATSDFLKHAVFRSSLQYRLAERARIELSGDPMDLVIFDAKEAYQAAFQETRLGEINKHMATAREGFQRCLRSQPKNQLCHYGMGLIHSSVKASKQYSRKKASHHFARARDLPEAHVALGRMHRFEDDLPRALAAMRRALHLDPNHQLARLELGIVYKLDGRDKAAIKALVTTIQLNRFTAEAKRALDELSVLAPEHLLVKQALSFGTVAGDLFSNERFQAAVAMVEERLGGVESNAPEQAALDKILTRLLGAADASSKIAVNVRVLGTDVPNALALPNGNVYFTRGLLDFIAKEWPSRGIDVDNDVVAHILAHEVAHVIRNHSLQSVLFRQAAQSSFRSLDIGVLTHVSRLQEIEADRVGMVMAFLAGYHPRGGIELMEARGQTEEIPQNLDHPTFEERIQYLEEYWSNDVKYAFVSFGLGVRALKKGDAAASRGLSAAATHYRKALAHFRRYQNTLQPSKAVLNNMGVANARLGIYAMGRTGTPLHRWQSDYSVEKQEAIRYVSVVREEQEQTRGSSQKRAPKSLRQGIVLFRKALEKDPHYTRARENLAAAYIAAGKYSKAQDTLSRVKGRATKKGRFALLRGIIYAEQGHYAKSGNAFRYAQKQKKTRKAAMYNMARLYQKAKHTDKARDFYKNYLDEYPRGPWAAAAKRALERI